MAFAAYLRNYYDPNNGNIAVDQATLDVLCRRPGTVLDGLPVIEGQSPTAYSIPCIVVNCAKSTPLSVDFDAPWEEVELDVHVMSQLEEQNEGTEENAATLSPAAQLHAERVGAIEILMSATADIMAAMNEPVSPPDNRPVTSFNVFGYFSEGKSSEQSDLHWDDVLMFKVHCAPYDPA